MNSENPESKKRKGFLKNLVIVAFAFVILFGSIFFSNTSSEESLELVNETYAFDSLSSGPFSINKSEYKVDELLFFTVNGIYPNEYGEALFIRPDGEIYHKVYFDGRKSSTLNHYFTPAPRDNFEKCSKCNVIGNWTISFRIFEGLEYKPIYFEVIERNPSNKK